MVELIVNDNLIELPKGTDIKYTKQISEIFDIASVACSFTNSFEFDKTPFNTQAMQFLGISGDGSPVPYNKNTSLLKVNGFDLVSQGWFDVGETTETYKGSIINGMIDFFKAIENKTMGNDIDLHNFNHEKLLATVVASFTNEYYQYIVADYGGKNIFEDGINIDYLTPCFSVKKLWELIFSTFGFNCDYTNLGYLDGLYLTYPKDLFEQHEDELVAELTRNFFKDESRVTVAGVSTIRPEYRHWDATNVIEGTLLENWKYVIGEKNSYRFHLLSEMYVTYRRPKHSNKNENPRITILKNGSELQSIPGNYNSGSPDIGEPRELEFNVSLEKGDVIEVFINAPANIDISGDSYRNYEWRHNHTVLSVYKTDLGTTTLENELKDFSVKDFVKEIIWRTGLTPVYINETNTVIFIKLDSRLDFANAQDYSHCFVKRKGEIYKNDYAQKNIFKLKRDSDSDFSGDGYLYVFNRNIADEKTLAQSKIYAPDRKIVTPFFNFSTNQYKIWNIEIKDNDDVAEITYKGLSGRFFFIRKETSPTGTYKIISEILQDETTVASVPYGVSTNTLFEESVYNYYAEYQKIFTNFRIHTIQLNLTEIDFLGLDLTRPVYFKQENAFYICNKVDFQEGEFSSGEFIKINK